MNKAIKNVIKIGAIWAAVGLIFALAAPSLAGALGIPAADIGVIADPKWLVPFFAGTAALAAAFDPVWESIFGDKKPEEAKSESTEKSPSRQVNINIQQAPSQAQGQAIIDAKFRQNIDAERIAAAITDNRRVGG